MLEGLSFDEARLIIERISGSTTIAYQLAYLEIQLQASKKELPEVIQKRHMFFLEYERILNHLYDMAVVSQFANFTEGASFLMRLVEEGRGALQKLTGNRFGFSAIRVDGSLLSLESAYEYLFSLERELIWFEKWLDEDGSLWKSLFDQGALFKKDIEAYGVVGVVARSVDMELDRRKGNRLYEESGFFMPHEYTGDAIARFKVQLAEIFISLRMVRPLVRNRVFPFFLGTVREGEYYSYVESSAGELMMYMRLQEGKIERFFVRDPTFLNAQILPLAMENSDISSLGLVSNSIPLNISASDL